MNADSRATEAIPLLLQFNAALKRQGTGWLRRGCEGQLMYDFMTV